MLILDINYYHISLFARENWQRKYVDCWFSGLYLYVLYFINMFQGTIIQLSAMYHC